MNTEKEVKELPWCFYPMADVFEVFEALVDELDPDYAYTIEGWMNYARPGFWDKLSDYEKACIEYTFKLYVTNDYTLDICVYKNSEYPPRYVVY